MNLLSSDNDAPRHRAPTAITTLCNSSSGANRLSWWCVGRCVRVRRVREDGVPKSTATRLSRIDSRPTIRHTILDQPSHTQQQQRQRRRRGHRARDTARRGLDARSPGGPSNLAAASRAPITAANNNSERRCVNQAAQWHGWAPSVGYPVLRRGRALPTSGSARAASRLSARRRARCGFEMTTTNGGGGGRGEPPNRDGRIPQTQTATRLRQHDRQQALVATQRAADRRGVGPARARGEHLRSSPRERAHTRDATTADGEAACHASPRASAAARRAPSKRA